MVGVAGSVRRGGGWRGSRSQDDVRQGERRKPSCPVPLKKVLPSTSLAKACIGLFIWRLAQPRDGGCSTSSRGCCLTLASADYIVHGACGGTESMYYGARGVLGLLMM